MKSTLATVQFQTKAYSIKDWTIVELPEADSLQMPSRGQVSVTGTINGNEFATVLEPDGRAGHWFHVMPELEKIANVKPGDDVSVELTTSTVWPEPTIPKDFAKALKTAPDKVKEKWDDITPMARWEWIRWMNSTANEGTRTVRIEKTISKLNGKHRRPCCFNLAACTEPYVAKSGQLLQLHGV